MNTKHYKLIIAIMLLGWVATFPLMYKEKIVEVVKVETVLDPITITKTDVYNQLTNVYQMEPPRAAWWSHHIAYASDAHQVPSNILISVLSVESEFQLDAKSSAGAIGPAQVVPASWKKSLGYDIKDPIQNIYAGAYILNNYKETCGDWNCALRSYNVGITNFLKGKKKTAQTQYVNKVKVQLAAVDGFTARSRF